MIKEGQYIEQKAELLQLITTEQAWHYHIIPLSAENGTMVFYADESYANEQLAEELELIFGKNIRLEKVTGEVMQKSLAKLYRRDLQSQSSTQKAELDSDSGDFLINLIAEAKRVSSSDIHIEPYEERNRIRMRIDGMLVERYVIDPMDYPGLINKIKIKANLDIAEKRLPQDGRIYFEQGKEKFDIRVSIIPALYGEKVVMRLLRNDASNVDLEAVGMDTQELSFFLEGVRKPHGIILVSGPTGSGKTTTLYATLKLLNKEVSNIMTVEDPIEYTLEGINQVQVKESIGLTFARALRTFLRQDPDIIMVGEIRDQETASIAIRAALTGHLVLSTIHTNSAWGSVSRMIDMGVPAFLLASTLNTTAAQRLVRKLCPHCKQQADLDTQLYPRGFMAPYEVETHYLPVGCAECYHVGYKGRKAIFEVIPIDHDLMDKIKVEDMNVRELLKQRSVSTLADNAFRLFATGETSLEEVYPILLNQRGS